MSGRLEEASARELVDVCHRQRGIVLIDLEELISLDRASVEALQDLRASGARVVGASHYIQMLLNGRPEGPAAAGSSRNEKERE